MRLFPPSAQVQLAPATVRTMLSFLAGPHALTAGFVVTKRVMWFCREVAFVNCGHLVKQYMRDLIIALRQAAEVCLLLRCSPLHR